MTPEQLAAAAEAARLAAAATPPQPVPNVPSAAQMADWTDEKLATLPEDAQTYIRGLRYEAMKNRQQKTEAQTRADLLEAEKIERARAEAEAEAIKEKNYAEAKRINEEHAKTEVTKANLRVINAEVRSAAIAAGIPPKLIDLIRREAITMDNLGNVQGIEAAIEKCKSDYAEYLTPPTPAAAVVPPVDPNAPPPNPADNILMPGTGMTYGAFNKLVANQGNAGKPPIPAAAKPATVFDARKAKPEDADKRFKELTKGK